MNENTLSSKYLSDKYVVNLVYDLFIKLLSYEAIYDTIQKDSKIQEIYNNFHHINDIKEDNYDVAIEDDKFMDNLILLSQDKKHEHVYISIKIIREILNMDTEELLANQLLTYTKCTLVKRLTKKINKNYTLYSISQKSPNALWLYVLKCNRCNNFLISKFIKKNNECIQYYICENTNHKKEYKPINLNMDKFNKLLYTIFLNIDFNYIYNFSPQKTASLSLKSYVNDNSELYSFLLNFHSKIITTFTNTNFNNISNKFKRLIVLFYFKDIKWDYFNNHLYMYFHDSDKVCRINIDSNKYAFSRKEILVFEDNNLEKPSYNFSLNINNYML